MSTQLKQQLMSFKRYWISKWMVSFCFHLNVDFNCSLIFSFVNLNFLLHDYLNIINYFLKKKTTLVQRLIPSYLKCWCNMWHTQTRNESLTGAGFCKKCSFSVFAGETRIASWDPLHQMPLGNGIWRCFCRQNIVLAAFRGMPDRGRVLGTVFNSVPHHVQKWQSIQWVVW